MDEKEKQNLESKLNQRINNPTLDDFILYGIFHENKGFFLDYDMYKRVYSNELGFYNEDFRARVLELANEAYDRWNKTKELPSDYCKLITENINYS